MPGLHKYGLRTPGHRRDDGAEPHPDLPQTLPSASTGILSGGAGRWEEPQTAQATPARGKVLTESLSMSPFPASPSLADVRRRPSSAGELLAAGDGKVIPSYGSNNEMACGVKESDPNINITERERPVTAPPRGLRREMSSREQGNAVRKNGGSRWGQIKKERGVSARAVEKRLEELRADDEVRAAFLQEVDGILEKRNLYKAREAWAGTGQRPAPKTRKTILLELQRAHPLDTGRKADLVERLRSGGLEANRATQTLLDPATKEVLAKRANSCRRLREERIRQLVSSCRRRRLDQQLAVRASQALKDQKSKARRERARQARSRAAQTKAWLIALKMHAGVAWVVTRLSNVTQERRRSEAAKVITRHVIAVARHRFKLRLEAATKVIDEQFAKKIRRWKTKRDAEATDVLKRFLIQVKSSDVRTRVKLLAYRIAVAHVHLARLQRWWRRRRREMAACRQVMCRLWEQEVDRRVDVKVDEVWRARNEASLSPEHGSSFHAEGPGSGAASAGGTLRWGAVRHAPSSSATSPGGAGHGPPKGRNTRQAKEEQARGERSTIRSHILSDPLMNPPADLKTKMCGEYVKQMALRHAWAVGDFDEKVKHIAEMQMKTTKFGEKGSLLAVSLAAQARRRAMNAKGLEIAGMPVRPRWRSGPMPGEVAALVDAGTEYVVGLRWLWEPSTPSRLEDGTLVADSMPTPECLASRVASKFRNCARWKAASSSLPERIFMCSG